MKAATYERCGRCYEGNIAIHAAREGGDYCYANGIVPTIISIHAAREGGDVTNFTPGTGVYISIHAAREGGDTFKTYYVFPH